MRLLNRHYRGVDRSTDVLSFPQYAADELKVETRKRSQISATGFCKPSNVLPLGDIVINLPYVKKQALERHISFDEALKHLLIHGLLHLVGYDHEQDAHSAARMRRKSRQLLEELR